MYSSFSPFYPYLSKSSPILSFLFLLLFCNLCLSTFIHTHWSPLPNILFFHISHWCHLGERQTAFKCHIAPTFPSQSSSTPTASASFSTSSVFQGSGNSNKASARSFLLYPIRMIPNLLELTAAQVRTCVLTCVCMYVCIHEDGYYRIEREWIFAFFLIMSSQCDAHRLFRFSTLSWKVLAVCRGHHSLYNTSLISYHQCSIAHTSSLI